MNEDLKNLEERAKNLARKKASLQQVVHMMEQLKLVPSLEILVENILQILLQNIGGQNIIMYYRQDSGFVCTDIFGNRKIIEKITDPPVQITFETKKFFEKKNRFEETLMTTLEIFDAVTWVFPLLFDDKIIGAIKVENILGTHELRDELPTFFNYVSLLIVNQLQNEKLQWANSQLESQLDEIQKTEEALRISEKRLTLALEAANEYWYEFNFSTGEVIFSDPIYFMLGYDRSELSARTGEWENLIHPDDKPMISRFIENIPQLIKNENFKLEFRMRRKNGTYIWILGSGKILPASADGKTMLTGTLINITDNKLAQEKLLLSAKVFEQSNEGIIISDSDNKIVSVNRSFSEITGYTLEDVKGKNPSMLSSGRHDREFFDLMWRQLTRFGHWKGEIWNRRKDGSIYLEWLSISQVRNPEGNVINYIGIFNDITYFKETEKHIQQLAHFDPLTGLPNRTLLNDRINQAINRAQRDKETLAIIFIDLDQFKQINDTLGHRTGDELLIQVARRFKSELREEDTLSRFGGDEFVLLLPDTDMHGASLVAQKLLNLNTSPYSIGNQELSITSSMGAAVYPADGEDIETLYRCADTAMFRAKKEGRNSLRFFTQGMQDKSARKLQLLNALRRAVEKNEFSVYFQPQITIDSKKVIGAEALLRWNHPELGFIAPSEFIPLAEESGIILLIGEWVLRATLQQLNQWISDGTGEFIVAVNLSAIQLKQPGLPALISDLLQEMNIPPNLLELELTESVAMENPEAAISIMNQLHKKGVKFAIDDFGTGYSSLNYLKRFKIDKLKIDHSFIKDLGRDSEDEAIVLAITGMARSLKLHTIAEGVETQVQLEFLRNCGCDQVQGFLYSKALPAEEFKEWIQNFNQQIIKS